VPFAFLDDVKNRFFATYGDKGQAAIAFAYNEDFGRTIQKQLEFYNGPQADQFATVHKKLDDVKNVMVQNIEMVLERGEKLELLVDKSEQLQLDSFRFQKSSKKLRQAMFWKKVKIYMLIACVVLVLLYIFLAVLCGPTFEKCGNKDKK
jgi:vesicle-associated membrane protein 7|tara:strand:- start:168 stop:614 length:447 start_codon:yes stop_codon:yes gene_type:complete